MDNKIATLVDKKHYVCGFLENSFKFLILWNIEIV